MRPRAVVPLVPVAVHQPLSDVRLDLGRFGLGRVIGVARVVAAIGIDAGGEREALPHGAPRRPRGATGELRQLAPARSVGRGHPELPARDICDQTPVGGPACLRRARRVVGKGARLAAGDWLHVRGRQPTVACDVGHPHHVQHEAAVGCELRIGHLLDPREVVEGHDAALLRRQRRIRERETCGERERRSEGSGERSGERSGEARARAGGRRVGRPRAHGCT